MKQVLVFCALLALGVACSPPPAQENADAPAVAVREYPQWTRMFDAPRNVSMQLMLLCRMPRQDEKAYLDSPHAQYFVQVYVNPAGEKTMREAGARVFPGGTVIVKEKWKRDASLGQDRTAKQPAGLGILFKQAGAWQYAYMDEAGNLTRDQAQLEHCRVCHEKNTDRDAVFYPGVLSPGE